MAAPIKRVIKDYNTLSKEHIDLINEHYPNGFENDNLVSFVTPKGQFIKALEVRTDDTIYLFKIDKNMYKTYTNVHQVVYKLLVNNVLPQYQASNTPGLTGWDTTMTIIDIFAQLDATFGKPDAQAILINNANFWAPLLPMETPETLFL